MAPMSIELKPAVRVCTERKKPASTRAAGSSAPSVPGLFHSMTVRYTVPPTSSTSVPQSTSLVFIVQCSGRRNSLRSCMMTGKPSPPRMIAAAIGRQMNGSATKAMRLSVVEGETRVVERGHPWNTACQAASPRP